MPIASSPKASQPRSGESGDIRQNPMMHGGSSVTAPVSISVGDSDASRRLGLNSIHANTLTNAVKAESRKRHSVQTPGW
ncbi:MAG: hypothetical protein R3C19_07095 [Planctomycetaceae bacterium]